MSRGFVAAIAAAAVLGLGAGAGAAYVTTPRATANAAGLPAAAAGTVEKVDPNTATVKTANGSSIEVPLASATIQKQEKATLADLEVGDAVLGRGRADAQGVVKLQTLQVLASARGGGQRGAGSVAGTIQKIDGQTLTLATNNGGTTTATLAADTRVERVVATTPADLKPGQSVAVARGQTGAVVTITSG